MECIKNTYCIKYMGKYIFEVNHKYKCQLSDLYEYLEDFDDVLNDSDFKTELRKIKINKLEGNNDSRFLGDTIYYNPDKHITDSLSNARNTKNNYYSNDYDSGYGGGYSGGTQCF